MKEYFLHPYQHHVKLYRDSNLRKDKIKDDNPFRSMVVWPGMLTTTPRICAPPIYNYHLADTTFVCRFFV